ncbi:hypothetical protein A7982_12936 [Minicystis rosea]|nr:hypothetical protein A7982_12936 [Minicystis rosea]
MITLRTEIVIEGTAARIWEVLTDLPRYPAWNPFTPEAQGHLAPGARVDLRVRFAIAGLIHAPHRVVAVEPRRKLSWAQEGPPPWLLSMVREQILHTMPDGRVRLENRLLFDGLLAWPVHALVHRAVRRGFHAMERALRSRVEQAKGASSAPEIGANDTKGDTRS